MLTVLHTATHKLTHAAGLWHAARHRPAAPAGHGPGEHKRGGVRGHSSGRAAASTRDRLAAGPTARLLPCRRCSRCRWPLTARNASILIPPNSATTATARSWSPLSWQRPSTAASTVGPARRSPASLLLVDCKHALVHCGCRLPVHPSTLAQQRSDGAPGDCLTSTQPHTF